MSKERPYLRLVVNNKSAQEDSDSGAQDQLALLKHQLAIQLPTAFDSHQLIRLAPASLGLEDLSQFENPNTGTPYLRVSKDLNPRESWENRLGTIGKINFSIRAGIKNLYGQNSFKSKTHKAPWTLHLPFGIQDELTNSTSILKETIKLQESLYEGKLPPLKISQNQLVLNIKAPTLAELILATRKQFKLLRFTLEGLEDILI